MIISMTVFGTLGLFVRYIPLSSGELALSRAILAIAIIGSYLLLTRQKIPFSAVKKDLPLLLLSGAAMGINWILLFQAYKYTTVSVATLSYYFAPVLVTVLCPVIFKERMRAKQWLCFLMSTVGLAMLTVTGGMEKGKSDLTGILFGLGAAVFYASVVLLNKFIKGVGGIHRTFLQFVSATMVLIPYVLLSGSFGLGSLNGVGWASLVTVGLFHTGITYCLYFSALKELPGQKAAILSYIDPLVAVLVSVAILHETITVWQIIGGVLILGFTLLNEISVKANKRR